MCVMNGKVWCIQCHKNGTGKILIPNYQNHTHRSTYNEWGNHFCSIHNVDHRKSFYVIYNKLKFTQEKIVPILKEVF